MLRLAAGGADEDGIAALYPPEQFFFSNELFRVEFLEFFEMIFFLFRHRRFSVTLPLHPTAVLRRQYRKGAPIRQDNLGDMG